MNHDPADSMKGNHGVGPLPLPRSEGVRAQGPSHQLKTPAPCPLEVSRIAAACNALQTGQGAYRALLYLHRALACDVPALFASSRGEIDHRWQVLWVLSPIFARLARHPEGAYAISVELAQDLVPIQFFATFSEHHNSGAEKLLERLRHQLLALLLCELKDALAQPKRVVALSALVAKVETDRDALGQAVEVVLGPEATSEVLPLLVVCDARAALPSISTVTLGARLASALRTKAADRDDRGERSANP